MIGALFRVALLRSLALLYVAEKKNAERAR